MKRYGYLICENDEFELPLTICDTIRDVAEYLSLDYQYCKNMICGNDKSFLGGFIVEKVTNL